MPGLPVTARAGELLTDEREPNCREHRKRSGQHVPKQHRRLPQIPSLGLTEEEGRSRGLEAGGTDFVVKPIDPEALQGKIEACLGSRESERRKSG